MLIKFNLQLTILSSYTETSTEDAQNMHDGALPHFALAARAILHQRFPNKWIGRQGPTQWPARFPDLNPFDFYLWGHLKAIVYSTPILNLEILHQRME